MGVYSMSNYETYPPTLEKELEICKKNYIFLIELRKKENHHKWKYYLIRDEQTLEKNIAFLIENAKKLKKEIEDKNKKNQQST